ncbi:MAG: type II secretion system protein [Candidatus Fimenecus sp.]
MFRKKAEKKARKNGFTLVELIVTVTILSIVTLMTVQLSNSFYHRYAMIEARWTVQNAAKRVMQYFQSENESLANSTSVSLFYTDPDDRGTVPASADPSLMQGVPATGNDTYAYIYTMPASDPTQGDVIWVLERGEGKTPVNLTEYILDEEVPLNIAFSVSTVPIEVSKGETIVNPDGSTTVPYTYGGGEDKYLTNTVDVTISTPVSVGGNFSLTTSFTMNNIMQNQQINYENGVVCKTSGDVYVAGWDDENIDCPVDTTVDRLQYATQSANILRYISAESFLNSQNTDTADFSAEGAGLCFGALCMEGSSIGTQVKGALRDFRDNVLAKSEFGNTIIDKYYNEWSPALLRAAAEHPSLKTLGKIVLVPASVIAFFAAE